MPMHRGECVVVRTGHSWSRTFRSLLPESPVLAPVPGLWPFSLPSWLDFTQKLEEAMDAIALACRHPWLE